MVRAVPRILRAPHLFLTEVTARHGAAAAIPLPRTPVLVLADPAASAASSSTTPAATARRPSSTTPWPPSPGPACWPATGSAGAPTAAWSSPRSTTPGCATSPRTRSTPAPARRRGGRAGPRPAAGGPRRHVPGRAGGRRPHPRRGRPLERRAPARRRRRPRPRTRRPPRRQPRPRGLAHAVARPLSREVAAVDGVCARILADRARRPLDDPRDLVGLMLAAGMDDRQVRDELVTFVVAGHETVASSLTWTLDLLSRNPPPSPASTTRSPRSTRRPAGTTCRGCRSCAPRSTRPCACTARLGHHRQALADDVVAGVDVPAGTLVIVCTWALHRDPRAVGRPDRVPARAVPRAGPPRPLRPLRRRAAPVHRPRPRLVEEVLVLAELLRTHTVRPAGPPRPVDALVTLRPRGGLPLHVERLPGSRP